MNGKQTTLDLNGPILSFIQQPQSVGVCDAVTHTGTTTPLIEVTSNGYPVRGYLYYPTSPNTGQSLDVVVLYHGTITSPGVSPTSAASTFINIALNRINLKDKLIFSVAYPQDAIPLYEANPSLAATQFPGLNYSTFYFGDNIVYAEAALLWVKNNLNVYMSSNGVPKTINRVYTFGHSQGAYLVHRLNTMHPVDGVISNAPGPIDLLDRCSIPGQQTANVTCNKIGVGIGTTSANPEAYNTRSLKSYLSGTLSPQLFTQALDDEPYQVNLMQTVVQPGLATCTNCSTITFNYYTTGGHDSFVTNTIQQQDIRNFVGAVGAGITTFVGIATAFFPEQNPPNPASNTGTLSYRWSADGFGPLTDGTFQGASITGSGTTTLTITNAKSPAANGLRLFVGVDYVPSAYSQPVGSAVTVGTGRSTGNAVNEILNSNSATLTVFPVLSVAQQPISQTAAQTRTAIFTTLGALTDTTQGNILYRWQLNGNDLSDSATVIGSGTTSLSVSLPNIINSVVPIISGSTRFYLINFSVPVDTASIPTFDRIGAAGNSQPTLTIVEFVRISSQQYRLRFAVTGDNFCRNFTIQATPSFSQPILQNNTVTHITRSDGSATISIDWSPGTTTNTVRARLTHPTACNSPIFTNTVNFSTVLPRAIINFEQYDSSSASITNVNLFNGEFTLLPANTATLAGFYAPERDINVEMDIFAAAGRDSGGFRGGEGGFSRVRFTLPQNVEFLIAGFNFGETGYIYRRSSLMLIVGAGGYAGPGGNGGRGGGIGVAGSNGSGRGGGIGAAVVAAGTLGQNGVFGSTANVNQSPRAAFPQGGRAVGCPPGDFWSQQGVSACQNLGNTQFRLADGTVVGNSAVISRGFKAGRGVRQTAGAGDSGAIGGTGATGGNGGTGGGGAGGGSGYQDGSIQVVQTSLGGSTSARIIVRAIL